MRAPTCTTKHPAVAAAERAVRRNLSHLTPAQVFRLAAIADVMRYGEDRGFWELSAQHAARQAAQGGTR